MFLFMLGMRRACVQISDLYGVVRWLQLTGLLSASGVEGRPQDGLRICMAKRSEAGLEIFAGVADSSCWVARPVFMSSVNDSWLANFAFNFHCRHFEYCLVSIIQFVKTGLHTGECCWRGPLMVCL